MYCSRVRYASEEYQLRTGCKHGIDGDKLRLPSTVGRRARRVELRVAMPATELGRARLFVRTVSSTYPGMANTRRYVLDEAGYAIQIGGERVDGKRGVVA